MRKWMGLMVILGLLSVGGCAFSDPRISGTPPTPPVEPEFIENVATSTQELQTTWATVAGLAKLDPDQPKWATMAETLEALWIVVVGPDPVNRIPAFNADIGEPATFATVEEATKDAEEALTSSRDVHREMGKTSSGMDALLWGSIAASCAQMLQGLTGSYQNPVVANQQITVTITDEESALKDLIISYDEAIFALRTSQGFSSWDIAGKLAPMATSLDRQMSRLMLIADERDIQVEAVAIYDLPAGRDDQAAMVLLRASQASVVDSAAVWLASADSGEDATNFLISASTVGLSLGVGTAQWPGFPDTT
ncbi:MAG: hypothetical protein FWG08_03780 [Propionibacteriaceae bacterium]|nr:hypothetical protein [Propionibacteriaceae bacterium]